MRRLIISTTVLLGGLVVIFAVLGWSYWKALQHNTHSLPENVKIFEIQRGESFSSIAARLKEQGIISDEFGFKILARQMDVRSAIKSGEYELPNSYTYPALLEHFVSGQPVMYTITFPEGWTFRDYKLALSKHEKVSHTLDNFTEQELVIQLGIPYDRVEGWFFPDTYSFPKGTSDLEIIKNAYEKMKSVLNVAWEKRDQTIPLASSYELLTLASIIEKETSLANERGLIAGVFINRLRKGMKLQTDPTVIYGLGDSFDGNLTRAHLREDSEYNTYRIDGLPPSPIAMPGEDALLAAANPVATTALFFVADGSGGHTFSDNLKDHNEAVRKYQVKK